MSTDLNSESQNIRLQWKRELPSGWKITIKNAWRTIKEPTLMEQCISKCCSLRCVNVYTTDSKLCVFISCCIKALIFLKCKSQSLPFKNALHDRDFISGYYLLHDCLLMPNDILLIIAYCFQIVLSICNLLLHVAQYWAIKTPITNHLLQFVLTGILQGDLRLSIT